MVSFNKEVDLVVIGGGPAGLCAALSSWDEGIREILVIERDERLGGILNQCIHDGFGVELFKRSLTGPEYAKIYIDRIMGSGVKVLLSTMAVDLNRKKEVIFSNKHGIYKVRGKAVILAMGARERTPGAITIPGTRPSGIFTAGTAQRLMNLQNRMIGKEVVIIGSGDVGLIMAKTLTLEGAKVKGVVEILPYPTGLTRNLVHCLQDFGIPLYLSHTVVEIRGKERVTSIVIGKRGPRGGLIKGSKMEIRCDTLLFSIGLIPENELSRNAGIMLDGVTGGPFVDGDGETNIPGIFACGNVLQIHDLVDHVTMEAERVGRAAASYIKGDIERKRYIRVIPGEGIRQVIPQLVSKGKDILFSIRVKRPMTNKRLLIMDGERILKEVNLYRVSPSEMIRTEVSKVMIDQARTIRVEMG